MIPFILGVCAGIPLGILVTCLCVAAAKREDAEWRGHVASLGEGK